MRIATQLGCLIVLLGVCLLPEARAQGPQTIMRGRKGIGGGVKKGGPGMRRLPGPRLEALERMTPEQQERFIDSLPPPRRSQAREMLSKWRDMTPPERARARRMLGEFQGLAPERQQRIRMLYGEFNSLPVARQRALRNELRSLRALSEEERGNRLDSESFREKYYPAERRLLDDLSSALPSLEPESNEESAPE